MRTGRIWWAKTRLVSALGDGPTFGFGRPFLARTLRYPEYLDAERTRRPQLEPYEGLAEFWDPELRTDYACFVTTLARCRGIQLRSALDLACGTGKDTERLGQLIPEVVGLDASDSMLARARKHCSHLRAVRFSRGDFRCFELSDQFDAVVCAGNSLNYVGNVGELNWVFRCVAAHLRPGGLFVFDTVSAQRMQQLSGCYCHFRSNGRRAAVRFDYDRVTRCEEALALVPSGVEIHRRIPIDPEDVHAASQESGLIVVDWFSGVILPGRWKNRTPACYFVVVVQF